MSKDNRTLLMLQDNLDEELSWRIKELHIVKSKIPTTHENGLQDAIIRASITMIYAHWEGFVKSCAENYLNFVALRRLKHNELQSCFVTLCLKNKINELKETNKFELQQIAVDFMLQQLDERANIPYEGVILTKSNLKFWVFRDICIIIGIDYKTYQLREKLIDQLVDYRNTIAHGKYLEIKLKDYEEIYNNVTEMLRQIKNDIMNAAIMEKYKRS